MEVDGSSPSRPTASGIDGRGDAMKKAIVWIALGVAGYVLFLKGSEAAQRQGTWHQAANRVES
ncbi:hypothetical protein [Arcanobacterium pluranimalium]|uniref:hypothetical protein n=1 Tax=Arcanobacterium pluranimalium TaxID=108028 RepID=UPI00195A63CC|nr:hypothetical protein [Arcanobacterium pluranimalium]